MKKIHIAISTHDIEGSVKDYSARLGTEPCVVINGEYALWRTQSINLSPRNDPTARSGELRHLGWEDPDAASFSSDSDINGILWERFSADQQQDEINEIWPETNYSADLTR